MQSSLPTSLHRSPCQSKGWKSVPNYLLAEGSCDHRMAFVFTSLSFNWPQLIQFHVIHDHMTDCRHCGHSQSSIVSSKGFCFRQYLIIHMAWTRTFLVQLPCMSVAILNIPEIPREHGSWKQWTLWHVTTIVWCNICFLDIELMTEQNSAFMVLGACLEPACNDLLKEREARLENALEAVGTTIAIWKGETWTWKAPRLSRSVIYEHLMISFNII